MKKIRPSEQISNEIMNIRNGMIPEDQNILSLLISKGMQKILQETLEQETDEFLGRGYYRHWREGNKKGNRNGYEKK